MEVQVAADTCHRDKQSNTKLQAVVGLFNDYIQRRVEPCNMRGWVNRGLGRKKSSQYLEGLRNISINLSKDSLFATEKRTWDLSYAYRHS
jgi:hypothetical protein